MQPGTTPPRRSPAPPPSLMRVESISLPLRFILTGFAALVIGVSLILARPEILTTYHYNQWVLAVTHLLTLGWLTSAIMGSMYQLVPVALETKLHSSRLAFAQFWLHLAGWIGLVGGFWHSNATLVAWFGGLVGLGVMLFVYNVGRTLSLAPVRNAVSFGIASALIWLSLAMLAGLLIAISKVTGYTPFDPLAQMHAHAHLGAVGFFVLMLMAVSLKLVPMFTLSEIQSERRGWWSILFLNAGLLGAFVTILFGATVKIVFAAVLVAAFAVYGLEMAAILRARKRRQLDVPIKCFTVALLVLVPLSVAGLILSWPGLPATALTTQLENVYGVLALLGLMTGAIIAMLYKIVPFLVWYYSYSRHIGRSKVPSLADLSSSRLQAVGFGLFLAALPGLCAGALLASDTIARWSCALLLASLLLFAVNLLAMLRHLRWPHIEPLVRSSPPKATPNL